ncbi:putative immunity/bacteriocin fusion bifunctional protein [Priestia aryabhattai]|uniref:putative immunity/bacteriocin fusion bifunctional protein n=1 Tax=Priestia aryabhattai TaxID=412384 RepID=UPI003D278188
MKNLFKSLMAFVILLGLVTPYSIANAQGTNTKEKSDCQTCSLKDQYSEKELRDMLEDEGVTIDDTSDKDKEAVQKLLNSKKSIKDELKKQKEKGFKNYTDAKMYMTFNNAHLGGYDYEKAVVYGTLLQDADGNVLVVSAWADLENNKLIKYEIGKVTNDNPNEFQSLVSYEKSKKVEGDFSASGFKWNGKSFACGMSGVLACITYCGVVGMACGPGAAACGTVCDVVCGSAFAYACS